MPALSSTMTEGKIVEWLKKPGDPVARGESVLVVESDKADMDVEAFQEGFLAAVLMPAGESSSRGRNNRPDRRNGGRDRRRPGQRS